MINSNKHTEDPKSFILGNSIIASTLLAVSAKP
jgi:hypothetical protein